DGHGTPRHCPVPRPSSQSAAMNDLIDIGVNLTHDSFDADRDAVIARAAAAGVRRLIVTGTTVTSSVQALELTAAHPGALFSTAGVHPHHASEVDEHTQM